MRWAMEMEPIFSMGLKSPMRELIPAATMTAPICTKIASDFQRITNKYISMVLSIRQLFEKVKTVMLYIFDFLTYTFTRGGETIWIFMYGVRAARPET